MQSMPIGMFMLFRLVHPLKALAPKSVTVSGIWIFYINSHPSKALSSIVFKSSGRVTSDNVFRTSKKVADPILVTLLGTLILLMPFGIIDMFSYVIDDMSASSPSSVNAAQFPSLNTVNQRPLYGIICLHELLII